MTEIDRKLEGIRRVMKYHGLGAVRLRGVDWFSWATGGGSSVVILTSETGIAEVLVTPGSAFLLTSVIEAGRLADEQVPVGFEMAAFPWEDSIRKEKFVEAQVGPDPVASDRPTPRELALPPELVRAKRTLGAEERDRYRSLGKQSAEAMTEVLGKAMPSWTESELAGEGARALWKRGIHPTLTLVAGEERILRYRHPTPTSQPLGKRAMLVFCGRRHGLYANLTRFVYFREPTPEEKSIADTVAHVEAAALNSSVPGNRLSGVLAAITAAYARLGHPGEEKNHHQGGTTGYLSREVFALPSSDEELAINMAVAWNPSLPGAKIEDTIVVGPAGLEILTLDPKWPTRLVEGRLRPEVLVRV